MTFELRSLCCFLLVVVCLGWTAGCGGDRLPLGRVTGTVTLDGEPLERAEIVFQPEDGRPSYAKTDSQGSYELMFGADQPGAQIGRHRVMITTFDVITEDEENPLEIPERLPDRYHRNSELVEEVQSGRNVIDFDLRSD